MMSSKISLITGKAKEAAHTGRSETGTAHFVCNSEGSARRGLPDKSPINPALPPAVMDKTLQVLLAQQCGVHLRVKSRTMFPNDAPSYSIIERINIMPGEGRPMDLAAALKLLEGSLVPANSYQIEGWLAELSTLVHVRRQDGFSSDLMLGVWIERLSEYPADVVHHILWQWPDIGTTISSLKASAKYWPAWADISPLLESQSQWRKAVYAALQSKA